MEIKCTINVTHLNHPETIPPSRVRGKIVFRETGPWCQKGWGPLPNSASPGKIKIRNWKSSVYRMHMAFTPL